MSHLLPHTSEKTNLTTQEMFVEVGGDELITVHVAQYNREAYQPRLVSFDEPTHLNEWCRQNDVSEALGGGFFLRSAGIALGELWIDGVKQPSAPFTAPWSNIRGGIAYEADDITISSRSQFAKKFEGDFLQAGPILLQDGVIVYADGRDNEGFSAASQQFDSDITDGRYPRSAIGVNTEFIWSVVCDGCSLNRRGLSLGELAKFMSSLAEQKMRSTLMAVVAPVRSAVVFFVIVRLVAGSLCQMAVLFIMQLFLSPNFYFKQ